MKKMLLSLVLTLVVSESFAQTKHDTWGHVTELSSYFETHTFSHLRGVVEFKLDVPLASPCTRVYFDRSEEVAVSILLSAKARQERIRVYYFSDVIGPWSTTTCQAYAVREH